MVMINPGILKFTLRTGQKNCIIAFIFVPFKEKGYYRVVSVGHLRFDCRSYCGGSRRMQGDYSHPESLAAHYNILLVRSSIWQLYQDGMRSSFGLQSTERVV